MSERIQALHALRAFEVASRYGSFTRAAEELALTQGAVSHHIKTLEAMFGCDLFERRGPKLSLTEHGRVLAQELKVGFKIIENACALLRQDRYGLRLKAPSTLTVRWLLRALDAFKKHEDHCSVQLSSVWMDIDSVDFYSEPYDCAILLASGRFPADIDSFKLFDEWLIPVCHPDYMAQAQPALSDLPQCEFLHPSPTGATGGAGWRGWTRCTSVSTRGRYSTRWTRAFRLPSRAWAFRSSTWYWPVPTWRPGAWLRHSSMPWPPATGTT